MSFAVSCQLAFHVILVIIVIIVTKVLNGINAQSCYRGPVCLQKVGAALLLDSHKVLWLQELKTMSQKFANMRSTKALKDYFALTESPPTPATLVLIIYRDSLSHDNMITVKISTS